MKPELNHWHPVYRSRDLKRKPVSVTIHEQPIVLFRTEDGVVGALNDACPHRGMRLSAGSVEGAKVVCPYHGWGFACTGEGHSPGTPRMTTKATHYEAVDRHGAIWLRNAGATTQFPPLERLMNGADRVSILTDEILAPLELVLDNFTEVEHTPTTHLFLGYALESMEHVQTRTEIHFDRVRVINCGPQKALPRIFRPLFGMKTGDLFTDDWTTWFSPVFSVYDQSWADPQTGEPRPDKVKVAVFFNPINPNKTQLFVFLHTTARRWGRLGLNQVLRPLLSQLVKLETRRDRDLLHAMPDHSVSLNGRRLGRFDKPLKTQRRYLEKIYRKGVSPSED